MNIIAVDDERPALRLLADAIQEAAPGSTLACFQTAVEALEYAKKNLTDVAFLDIKMREGSGLELAENLIKIKPDTNIIFVSGYSRYMDKAFELYASGFVEKPARAKRIARELQHLRFPVAEKPTQVLAVEFGPFTFDHLSQRAYRGGEDLLLMPREYAILGLLATQPNTYFAPELLFQKAWGQQSTGDFRSLYSHISRLRKKLNPDGKGPADIEHKRGQGYRLVLLKTPQL